MRKKRTYLLLGLILFCSVSFGQFRIAFVGGAHSSSVLESNDLPTWNDIKNYYAPRTGFHAGVLAELPFSTKSKLFLQPAVLFTNKGRKYAQTTNIPDPLIESFDSSQFINYIDIPLNIVAKFPIAKKVKFIIGAGPYASLFYNGKETADRFYTNGDFKSYENNDLPVGNGPGKYKTFDYGVNGLAGIEFGRVFITANYSRGLGDFYQSAVYNGHFHHQVIGGTLGVFLGKPVKLEEKVKDRDKDGVLDKNDECPDEPGTALTHGCPDKDGDGIADKNDNCPDVAGLAKYNGCPIPDTDGDGINDELDKCPTIKGVAKYNGCPVPDSDGDGVNDEEDKCPTVAGLAKNNGCPIPDSDGDGVNDEEDKCPKTKGLKENAGCPVISKEVVEKVNYAARRIQFEFAKATILPATHKVLDEVVKILKADPSLVLSIEGHTSNSGDFNANMKLSQARADNVKAYFISSGIDPSRLTATGYGPTRPLTKGKTEAEQAKNRRVELKLSNQ
ncbi:MAG TPA: OmpA family protein [Chitinophagaceae bacterium]|nr:OmpA family protein [Chitinophagaceae bacterium]